MKKNKKGSYIMEAAIVLPMIILAVISAVLIIMFFYSQMTERSQMHIFMRKEACLATNKAVSFQEAVFDGSTHIEKKAVGVKVYGKKYLIMPYRGLLREKGKFVVEGEWNVTDGVKYVRYCSMVKGIKNEQ